MFGHIVKAIKTPVEPGARPPSVEQIKHEQTAGPVASPIEGYTAQAQQEIIEQVTRHEDGRVVAERTQMQRVTMTPEKPAESS